MVTALVDTNVSVDPTLAAFRTDPDPGFNRCYSSARIRRRVKFRSDDPL
jgi:hypothetical protein